MDSNPPNGVDAHLAEVAVRIQAFKPGVFRSVMTDIVSAMLNDRIQWSDEFPIDWVAPNDKNAIGAAVKALSTIGIISRLDQNRRSTRESSRGRRVFKWRLANENLARTFLERNQFTAHGRPQKELFEPSA